MPANERTFQPVRWVDLDHPGLGLRALQALSLGSQQRAAADVELRFLERQLPAMEPADHIQYAKLEAARLVEFLRALRDEYRTYLEAQGCGPRHEVFWVVFRCAVVPATVNLLRDALCAYRGLARIDDGQWKALFGMPTGDASSPAAMSAREQMEWLVHEQSLREHTRGGPFGRHEQALLARRTLPCDGMQVGGTLEEQIRSRQRLWDECFPWTHVLTRLFGVMQDELDFQYGELAREGQQPAPRLAALPPLQRFVYEHLGKRPGKNISSASNEAFWRAFMKKLDRAHISLEELDPAAKKVRQRIQAKRIRLDTWEQCFEAKARASHDNGTLVSMRRAIKQTIHNAMKNAEAKLGRGS